MLTFRYTHRVRYRECDPMGVVYHTHYLDYFEAARTEALRELGLPYKEIEASGLILPVFDLAVQYRRAAHYDDELEITARIDEVPRSRITIHYEVRRTGEEEVLTTGHVSLCFVDRARNRPIPVPAHVRALFERAFTS